MRKLDARWIVLGTAMLMALSVACSDDSGDGGTTGDGTDTGRTSGRDVGVATDTGSTGGGDTNVVADTGGTTTDTGAVDDDAGGTDTGTAGDTGGAFDCNSIQAGLMIGGDCSTDSSICGDWGSCAAFAGDANATCRQICVPSQCETMCGMDENCNPLSDAMGNPQLVNGVQVGVCAVPPSGMQQAWQGCGTQETGNCGAGLICAITGADRLPGTCFPSCTTIGVQDSCTGPDGTDQLCAAIINDANWCVLTCDAETLAGCPTPMTCVVGTNPMTGMPNSVGSCFLTP